MRPHELIFEVLRYLIIMNHYKSLLQLNQSLVLRNLYNITLNGYLELISTRAGAAPYS